MTCAPNAFQNGIGLRVLEPGAAFTATWGITVEALSKR
jgi:galactose mutarotase-like enzyme